MSLRAKDLLHTSHKYAFAAFSPGPWRFLCLEAICLANRSCKLNICPHTGHTYATSEPGGISSTTGDTSKLYREATDSLVVGEATSPLTTGTDTAPLGGRNPCGSNCSGGGSKHSMLAIRSLLFVLRSRGKSCGEVGNVPASAGLTLDVRPNGCGHVGVSLDFSDFTDSNHNGRSESE